MRVRLVAKDKGRGALLFKNRPIQAHDHLPQQFVPRLARSHVIGAFVLPDFSKLTAVVPMSIYPAHHLANPNFLVAVEGRTLM